jgi:hypothetical protein
VVGVAALGGAAFFGLRSNSELNTLKSQNAQTKLSLNDARARAGDVEADRNRALLLGGASVVAAAAFLFTRDEAPVVTPTVGVSGSAAAVGVTVRLP